MRVLILAACCIYGSEGRKNEMFRFSKTSSGEFGGKSHQSWHKEGWIPHSWARGHFHIILVK